MRDPNASIILCVLGADPFGKVLDRTIASRTRFGRKIETLRIPQLNDTIYRCHLIFMSQQEKNREIEYVRALKGKPILTVGESEHFLLHGGIINLIIFEETVQFEVNLKAAQQAHLKLSSRMLALARSVIQ